MILNSKETTLAYRCPVCGTSIISLVGLFALSGDLIKLKCPSGCSELSVVRTKDKKVRLTVPCLLCPKPHVYTLSEAVFFERDLFALSCTYSGIDIAFIGTKDKVMDALAKSEKELLELLSEAGLDNFDSLRLQNEEEDAPFTDPEIEDIVRFVLADLDEEGKIHCSCGDEGGPYTFEFTNEGVKVECEVCGDSILIPMKTVSEARRFLDCSELHLK
ncbi:MAG: hypothetical protein IJA85_11005 [Clostridia bacterium]|nr:hypothetical protein [Clostridia bacterium]